MQRSMSGLTHRAIGAHYLWDEACCGERHPAEGEGRKTSFAEGFSRHKQDKGYPGSVNGASCL
jgi:hypothetical protein